jgi:hypothetical protein
MWNKHNMVKYVIQQTKDKENVPGIVIRHIKKTVMWKNHKCEHHQVLGSQHRYINEQRHEAVKFPFLGASWKRKG